MPVDESINLISVESFLVKSPNSWNGAPPPDFDKKFRQLVYVIRKEDLPNIRSFVKYFLKYGPSKLAKTAKIVSPAP